MNRQRLLPTFARGVVLALMAVAIRATASDDTVTKPSIAAAPGSSQLRVEKTSLILRRADGTSLEGTQLQGLVLQLPLGDRRQLREVRLASIVADPDDPEILRHEFQIRGLDGTWKSACEPNVDGETWGIPVALAARPGHPGVAGDFTLTCASGAVAKCIRYGYKPWAKGRNGEGLGPYHAACVHMIRADYCGNDQPHTKAGTFIKFEDDAVRWRRDPGQVPDPEFVFEAGWSEEGAVCLARVRWGELGAVGAVRASCPRLRDLDPDQCDEASARAKGALILNRSRAVPRLGR